MDWTEKLKLTLARSKSGKSKMVKVEANFWALLSIPLLNLLNF